MKKILTSILFLSSSAVATLVPDSAEALKVNVEPSITFRQSHEAPAFHRRKKVIRRQPVVYDVEHRYFDPIDGRMVIYHTPCECYEVVEYPVYSQPRCTRGTDFEVKFKLY